MHRHCRNILWCYNTQTPPHAVLLTGLPEDIHIGKHFCTNAGCTTLDGAPMHIGDDIWLCSGCPA